MVSKAKKVMVIKSYSELMRLNTFEDRYNYLKLNGQVGVSTFGYDRYINQLLYTSGFWKSIRNKIICRDNGCDLAVPGKIIYNRIIIHHLNVLTLKDIENNTELVSNPEFLICTSDNTHNAIHYGSIDMLIKDYTPRSPNDTCPWNKNK